MPAGDITMLDQKHAIVGVEHDATHAECHAAGKAPIGVEDVPQPRL
jgi:hypothetical protein